MSTRWFYILLANVAVLTVNIWLFVDKAQTVATSEVPIMFSPRVNKAPNSGISSIGSFHFPFIIPFTSEPENLRPQLESAQKDVSDKNKQIKNTLQISNQRAEKITLLETRNNRLHQKLFLLDAELAKRDQKLINQTQKIALLEYQQIATKSRQFTANTEFIKKSIEHKQDLVKLKKSSNKLDEVNQELLSDGAEEKRFSGSIEFGYTYEQDNQVTKGIKGRFVSDYNEPDKYSIHSDLEFEFESEDGDMSTDKYRWQLQSDYNLDPSNTVFARSDLNRSQFSSYEQEDIFTVGYGRIFLNTKKHKFNAEVGPGYRFAIPNAGKNAFSIDELIVRTRLNYERVISKKIQLKVNATLESGRSNSVYNLNFKAQNRIYQELYLIFNFEYKFTEYVPVDTVNTEISSGLSLLYAF